MRFTSLAYLKVSKLSSAPSPQSQISPRKYGFSEDIGFGERGGDETVVGDY